MSSGDLGSVPHWASAKAFLWQVFLMHLSTSSWVNVSVKLEKSYDFLKAAMATNL